MFFRLDSWELALIIFGVVSGVTVANASLLVDNRTGGDLGGFADLPPVLEYLQEA